MQDQQRRGGSRAAGLTGDVTFEIVRGRPRLGSSVRVQGQGIRRLGDLGAVTAVRVSASNQRIQYWTYTGVANDSHFAALGRLPVVYDLTFIANRPIGWERPKTHGHVHIAPDRQREGFAELYEVLHGQAGFLIQDLLPGPAAATVVLVEARIGQTVVIPPQAHHAVVNLGSAMLVLGDVVARSAQDEYESLRAARGMAYYLTVDGRAVPNPSYKDLPQLTRVRADEWSDASAGPLYAKLVERPADFAWLSQTGLFSSRFPELWHRYGAG